jgi:hypothetical protein
MTESPTTSPAVAEPTAADLAPMRRRLVARLEEFRRAVRAQLALEGFARVLTGVVGVALLSLVIDRWLRLSLPIRVVLLAAGVGYLTYATWRWIGRPLRMKLDLVGLAAAIDRRAMTNGNRNGNGNGNRGTGGPPLQGRGAHATGHPRAVASRVATALQLPDLLDRPHAPSAPMVERAVREAHTRLADVDFTAHLDRRRTRAAVAVLAGAILIPLLVTVIVPATVGLWARRWLLASNVPWPQDSYLLVAGLVDGRLVVPRGEPFTLRVTTRDGSVVPESVTLKMRPEKGRSESATMTRFDAAGDFRYEFSAVNQPTRVIVRGGDDVVGPFTLDPIDRPKVAKLELTSHHPTEERPTSHDFTGHDASASFLPKTHLELVITANVPVREARLKSATTQPSQSDLRRLDDKRFAVGWTHEAAVQMEVELVAAEADLTSPPTPIAIGLKVDQPPRVTLSYSGVKQRVTPIARVPLTVLARDDYGVASIDLSSKSELPAAAGAPPVTATTRLVGPATKPSETEIQHAYPLELAAMSLTPGTLLSLAGEATDGSYTGAQTGRSRPVTFRVVAPEELFREFRLRPQGERAKFRKGLEEAQKIQAGLQTLTSPAAAQQLARQHRLVQRESARIANAMAESLTEMKLNQLGGVEAHELMEQKVIAPLKALSSDTMTRQRDALDGLARNLDAQSLGETSARQEQIVAEMQAILKQMSQWDSFVDVLNQLNEIIKIQEQARERTEQMKAKETESLFD